MPGMLREQAANVLEQTANYELASQRDFCLSPPFNTLRCFECGFKFIEMFGFENHSLVWPRQGKETCHDHAKTLKNLILERV
jgi:hypothetical protein